MYQVFSSKDLVQAGFTTRHIHELAQCCLRRIRRGWFVLHLACSNPHHQQFQRLAQDSGTHLAGHSTGLFHSEEQAKLLVRSFEHVLVPGAVFSHVSAALLHGIPIVDFGEPKVELIRESCAQTYQTVRYRQRSVSEGISEVRGLPCTNLDFTLIDLCFDYPLHVSVPAIDYCLHAGLTSMDRLRQAAEARMPRRAAKKMETALGLSNGVRESVGESVMAVGFHTYGLPPFEWQVEVVDEKGRFVGRVDSAHRDAWAISEFDGAGKYTMDGRDAHESFENERTREYALRNLGFVVFRFQWKDLWGPEKFLQLKHVVTRSLRRRGLAA